MLNCQLKEFEARGLNFTSLPFYFKQRAPNHNQYILGQIPHSHQLPRIPVESGNQANCLCVIEGDFLPHARGCYHQKSAYVDSERRETVAVSAYVICFQSVWSLTETRSGRKKKLMGKWLKTARSADPFVSLTTRTLNSWRPTEVLRTGDLLCGPLSPAVHRTDTRTKNLFIIENAHKPFFFFEEHN